MKLSWIVVSGPQEHVTQALQRLEIIADTYLSVNTPSQNALADWLLQKEYMQRQVKDRIEKNKKVLGAFCPKAPLELLHAQGGWYGMVRLLKATSEEVWVLDLLERAHVLVHPGYFFDVQHGAHIILSYLTPEDIFKEGLAQIGQYNAHF